MLHGSLFAGRDAKTRSLVLIGALAAPQRYLRATAEWLSETAGYGVLTFDYRGVGVSAQSGDPTTNLDHWGDDVRAAIGAVRERFDPKTLLAVAHSLGGMVLGHSGAGELIDGALLIGATHGRPEFYTGGAKLRVQAAYRLLPRVAQTMGGLPAWSFLLTARVPRDVILHWTRWGREERFTTWRGRDSRGFSALEGPLLSVAISDDSYAPCAAVDALVKHFDRAGARRVLVDPRAHGSKKLGHFGLLNRKAPEWSRKLLLRWLADLEDAHV